MTFTKGMDADALRGNATRIRGARLDLQHVQQEVGQALDRAGSNWGGGDLDALMRQYRTSAAPALASLGDQLDDMARKVEQNIRAQKSTSLAATLAPSAAYRPGGGAANGKQPWSKTNKDEQGRTHTKTSYGPFTRYDVEQTTGEMSDADGQRGHHDTRVVGPRDSDVYRSHEESTKRGHVDANGEHSTTSTRRESTLFGRFGGTEIGRQITASHAWGENEYDAGRPKGEPGWGKDVSVKIASGDIEGWNASTFPDHTGEKAYMDGPGQERTGTYDVSVKDGSVVAAATVGAGAYLARGHAEVSDRQGLVQGGAKADVSVGANAEATASASIGKDGVKAEVGAQASAAARASAEADGSIGVAHGKVGAHAMVGAEAAANAALGIGKDGVSAGANIEGFAGGKAGVDGEVGVSGVTGKVGAEVSYGIGGHAKVDVQGNLNHIKADVDVGATLGLGAGVKFNVDVEPAKIMSDVSGAVNGGAGDIGHGLNHVSQSVNTGIESGFNKIFGR